jgi:hypothetical protein
MFKTARVISGLSDEMRLEATQFNLLPSGVSGSEVGILLCVCVCERERDREIDFLLRRSICEFISQCCSDY